jgi:CRISPR-associated protein Csb2
MLYATWRMSTQESLGAARPASGSPDRPAWTAPHTVFDDAWIALSCASGQRMSTVQGVSLARALRKALLRHAGNPPAEIVSGHGPDGRPSQRPHAAYVAVPELGPGSDTATVAGLAVVLPRAASEEERWRAENAVAAWVAAAGGRPRLYMGKAGALTLVPVGLTAPPLSLRPRTWCRPALRWISATPVVLDRYPGKLRSRDPAVAARAEAEARAIIARACSHQGLPSPTHVDITWEGARAGIPPTRDFLPYPGLPGRPQRFFVHATVTFEMPVAGPLILGAGRYEGMGLMQPL